MSLIMILNIVISMIVLRQRKVTKDTLFVWYAILTPVDMMIHSMIGRETMES